MTHQCTECADLRDDNEHAVAEDRDGDVSRHAVDLLSIPSSEPMHSVVSNHTRVA